MPFIADAVFDGGLTVLDTNGTQIDICFTQEPVTYAEATSTYTCGNDTVNTGAPEAADVDGRKVVVPAITAGSVTDTQTAGWWALTNGSDTLYATGALSATQAVTSGNTFSLDAIDIIIRDATAVV
jgi:hypothetical protein